MPTVVQMRQSLVVIFDIEGFSQENPAQQARLVTAFVESLEHEIRALDGLQPDAFSTGDGAIVCIGRQDDLDDGSVTAFLDFVIRFAEDMLASGIVIRTALNYSEMDRAVVLDPGSPLKGEFIQVGDTINDAARIILFAEAGEVLVSESVMRLLRGLDIADQYHFIRNEPFTTKHQQVIQTFSYQPTAAQASHFYDPQGPLHAYKRYSSFPPIKIKTFQYFLDNGLELELQKVIGHAYDALRYINETRTFLSWHSALQVLTELAYDPEDRVYVFSRNDLAGFWTQPRRQMYLKYLRSSAKGGYINQTRVIVYGTEADHADTPLDPEAAALLAELKGLHATNSLYNFPASQLFEFGELAELRFGFTVSKKHKYAIIPVPGPGGVEPHNIAPDRIGGLLREYAGYDPTDGPMKAIISADPIFVGKLLTQLERLLSHPQTELLK